MVISKVTKLNELKMADITTGQIGSLQMNDEMMEKLEISVELRKWFP